MTSAPEQPLSLPASCSQSNWLALNPFRIRWVAKIPLDLSHAGFAKDGLNHDDRREASAALAGKDGQEISSETGARICRMLEKEDLEAASAINLGALRDLTFADRD